MDDMSDTITVAAPTPPSSMVAPESVPSSEKPVGSVSPAASSVTATAGDDYGGDDVVMADSGAPSLNDGVEATTDVVSSVEVVAPPAVVSSTVASEKARSVADDSPGPIMDYRIQHEDGTVSGELTGRRGENLIKPLVSGPSTGNGAGKLNMGMAASGSTASGNRPNSATSHPQQRGMGETGAVTATTGAVPPKRSRPDDDAVHHGAPKRPPLQWPKEGVQGRHLSLGRFFGVGDEEFIRRISRNLGAVGSSIGRPSVGGNQMQPQQSGMTEGGYTQHVSQPRPPSSPAGGMAFEAAMHAGPHYSVPPHVEMRNMVQPTSGGGMQGPAEPPSTQGNFNNQAEHGTYIPQPGYIHASYAPQQAMRHSSLPLHQNATPQVVPSQGYNAPYPGTAVPVAVHPTQFFMIRTPGGNSKRARAKKQNAPAQPPPGMMAGVMNQHPQMGMRAPVAYTNGNGGGCLHPYSQYGGPVYSEPHYPGHHHAGPSTMNPSGGKNFLPQQRYPSVPVAGPPQGQVPFNGGLAGPSGVYGLPRQQGNVPSPSNHAAMPTQATNGPSPSNSVEPLVSVRNGPSSTNIAAYRGQISSVPHSPNMAVRPGIALSPGQMSNAPSHPSSTVSSNQTMRSISPSENNAATAGAVQMSDSSARLSVDPKLAAENGPSPTPPFLPPASTPTPAPAPQPTPQQQTTAQSATKPPPPSQHPPPSNRPQRSQCHCHVCDHNRDAQKSFKDWERLEKQRLAPEFKKPMHPLVKDHQKDFCLLFQDIHTENNKCHKSVIASYHGGECEAELAMRYNDLLAKCDVELATVKFRFRQSGDYEGCAGDFPRLMRPLAKTLEDHRRMLMVGGGSGGSGGREGGNDDSHKSPPEIIRHRDWVASRAQMAQHQQQQPQQAQQAQQPQPQNPRPQPQQQPQQQPQPESQSSSQSPLRSQSRQPPSQEQQQQQHQQMSQIYQRYDIWTNVEPPETIDPRLIEYPSNPPLTSVRTQRRQQSTNGTASSSSTAVAPPSSSGVQDWAELERLLLEYLGRPSPRRQLRPPPSRPSAEELQANLHIGRSRQARDERVSDEKSNARIESINMYYSNLSITLNRMRRGSQVENLRGQNLLDETLQEETEDDYVVVPKVEEVLKEGIFGDMKRCEAGEGIYKPPAVRENK